MIPNLEYKGFTVEFRGSKYNIITSDVITRLNTERLSIEKESKTLVFSTRETYSLKNNLIDDIVFIFHRYPSYKKFFNEANRYFKRVFPHSRIVIEYQEDNNELFKNASAEELAFARFLLAAITAYNQYESFVFMFPESYLTEEQIVEHAKVVLEVTKNKSCQVFFMTNSSIFYHAWRSIIAVKLCKNTDVSVNYIQYRGQNIVAHSVSLDSSGREINPPIRIFATLDDTLDDLL